MNVNTLVRRYSAAFAEYAKENIGISRAAEELGAFSKAVSESYEFRELLTDPEISHSEKCVLIDNLLPAGFSQETIDFLKLLVSKGRISLVSEIVSYMYDKYVHAGEVNAVIKTAHSMGPEIMDSLRQIAEKRLGKKFNITEQIEPALLGGMKIEMGNILMDASIRKDLKELGEKLRSTGVV